MLWVVCSDLYRPWMLCMYVCMVFWRVGMSSTPQKQNRGSPPPKYTRKYTFHIFLCFLTNTKKTSKNSQHILNKYSGPRTILRVFFGSVTYFAFAGYWTFREVYGMSECTGACTWSHLQAHQWGSLDIKPWGVQMSISFCIFSFLRSI